MAKLQLFRFHLQYLLFYNFQEKFRIRGTNLGIKISRDTSVVSEVSPGGGGNRGRVMILT